MHERFKSFDELESELLDRMKARGCSSITITGYRYLCNSIISWLQENGVDSYSQEGEIFSCGNIWINMEEISITQIFDQSCLG